MPALPTGGRTIHVIPGNGGGDGSESNPFQGIAAADAEAQPGDTFLVHAGDYGGERRFFDTAGSVDNYVAWIAADDTAPTMDDIRVRGDYIWIEGFDISAPDNAVRNEGASYGAVIKGNRITGCHYCIHLAAGAESWWISDNVIVGDQDPTLSGLSGEGIELAHTPGHSVAYNSISRVADGVSYPDYNVDIFGNDIFQTSDDGIEADDGYANIPILGNRIHNAHNNGITFQPMNGAPWYVIRNQVIGSNESVLKMRAPTDRVFFAHNTFVGYTAVFRNSAGLIRNTTLRNNLWISVTGGYFWEDTGSDGTLDSWRTDIDYDGFSSPASASPPLYKWKNVRYDDLGERQAASTIQQNAIEAPMSCYDTLDVPGAVPTVVPPQYVTLASGCNAIDSGEVLANINDGYLGSAPDRGAHEMGAPLQQYGPRGDETPGVDAGAAGASTGGAASATGGASGAGGSSGSIGGAASGGVASGGDASGIGPDGSVTGNSDGGDVGAGAGSDDDAGCACRVGVTRGALSSRLTGLAWLLALLGAMRRRRHDSA